MKLVWPSLGLLSQVRRCIIVVREGMTPFARSATVELQAQRGFEVEDFKESELMVDITEHVLVPKHEVSFSLCMCIAIKVIFLLCSICQSYRPPPFACNIYHP